MKKNYIAPSVYVQMIHAENMIAASITTIGGNAGIEKGTGDIPTEADVKGNLFEENVFDESIFED